mmetsp:Transcript_19125/g.63064  ORF Transcript_19125/g.63064 Transcript_19125/m.63064 type:complete len:424 (-) Transcript_19125:436-1707(-)
MAYKSNLLIETSCDRSKTVKISKIIETNLSNQSSQLAALQVGDILSLVGNQDPKMLEDSESLVDFLTQSQEPVRCEFTNAQLRVVGLVRCVLPEEETAGEAAGTHACSSNVDSSSKSTTTVGLILGVETARGVKVEAIIPGSPAFKTKSFQRGDVVAKINGKKASATSSSSLLWGAQEGSSIQIEVIKPNGASIFSILYFASVGRIFYQYQLMAAVVDLSKQIYKAADDETAVETTISKLMDLIAQRETDRLESETKREQKMKALELEIEILKKSQYADIQTLTDLKSRCHETDAELAMARKSEVDLRLSRQSLEDELVQVKKKLRETEDLLDKYRSSLRDDNSAVDEIGKMTFTIMDQADEIFRLNDLLVAVQDDLKTTRARLRHRELGIEEGMRRWHTDDSSTDIDQVKGKSLAGVLVPAS